MLNDEQAPPLFCRAALGRSSGGPPAPIEIDLPRLVALGRPLVRAANACVLAPRSAILSLRMIGPRCLNQGEPIGVHHAATTRGHQPPHQPPLDFPVERFGRLTIPNPGIGSWKSVQQPRRESGPKITIVHENHESMGHVRPCCWRSRNRRRAVGGRQRSQRKTKGFKKRPRGELAASNGDGIS